MKILQINEVYKILSTGRTTMELEELLEKNGHKSLVAYSYRDVPLNRQEKKAERQKGRYVIGRKADRKLHALYSRITGLQGYFSYFATRGLIRYINEEKPDVIHLHNVHGNFLNLNYFLSYLAREDIPLVLTLHDCWFYTGRCTHYTVNRCYQWREGCVKCPNNRNTLPSWFFDRSSKMWRDKKAHFNHIHRLAVIGVSDWITGQAECSFLKDAPLIKRIYNWIDFDLFRPVEAEDIRESLHLKDKFVILSVAAFWCNAKGLQGFLKLATKLSDCIILLVGKMDKKVALLDNIIVIPPIDNPASLARLYNAADVYVSLSKEESFGKTIAEAMACGTPVITCSTTALTEIVGNHCGYAVSDNSLKGFYQNILKVRKRGKEFYSKHCIHYARKHFSKESCGKEYIEVYEKLLSLKCQTDTK